MELSLDLIYKYTLKKVGTSSTYPRKDNCYVVDVFHRENGEYSFTIQYCPIPIFDMWEAMRVLISKYGVSKTDILPLIRGFNDWGDCKYDDAHFDASMDNSEEDL
jgi:hypothetical protein